MKKIYFAAILVITATAVWNFKQSNSNVNTSILTLENIEALADGETWLPNGTCYGAGPHFSDVSCPGGFTICAWCHTNVYGKD